MPAFARRRSGRPFMRRRGRSPVRRLMWDRTSFLLTTTSGSGTTVGQVIFDPQAFDFLPLDVTKLWAGCRLICNLRTNHGIGVLDSLAVAHFAIAKIDAAATTPQLLPTIPAQVDFIDYWTVQFQRNLIAPAAGFTEPAAFNPPESFDRRIRSRRVCEADERIVLMAALHYINNAPIDTNFQLEAEFVISNLVRARELKV